MTKNQATSVSRDEALILMDLPEYGTVCLPKSDELRSLKDKGLIRVIAIEPFNWVVELIP